MWQQKKIETIITESIKMFRFHLSDRARMFGDTKQEKNYGITGPSCCITHILNCFNPSDSLKFLSNKVVHLRNNLKVLTKDLHEIKWRTDCNIIFFVCCEYNQYISIQSYWGIQNRKSYCASQWPVYTNWKHKFWFFSHI